VDDAAACDLPPACLELRLDEHDGAPGRRSTASAGPSARRSEMNETSATSRSGA
jgi:hypothetical protein